MRSGDTRLTTEAREELLRIGDGGPLRDSARTLPLRRFEAVASRAPHLTAVVTKGERLTYAELDARANAMAARLRDLGATREVVVAICLRRRLDVLIAVLGVLKSGAAYLPLEPGQPAERRRAILDDAGASLLVATPDVAAELHDGSLPVVDPADVPPVDGLAAADTKLGDLAYIIYTSGSTGRPKGVMIEHRSVAAYVDWGTETFSADEMRSVLMATSFAFDMSVFEFMITLAVGGKIVLVDNLFEIRDMDAEGLTLVNAVPSLMAALLSAGIELPESITTAVFCGEALPFEVSEAVHRQAGIRRVVNTYGPTEDTVYSTYTDVAPGAHPTIGVPFPGTQAYVVDRDLDLVALGERGELCLSGVGLARGYKGLEELTAQRFVANPFEGGSGSDRIYRTGDLAGWVEGGSLQHYGRLDHQIKLHGVRIEPSEIEGALLRHDSVAQAVAVARPRPEGDKWLVAYVVAEGDRTIDTRSLRETLRPILPKPMIPSVIIQLEAMPLNANGKLDRAQLPEPGLTTTYAGPLSATEQVLAQVWREVLALETPVGPADDYFELGGTSLQAFELCEAIERTTGTALSPNVLLEASTVRSLGRLIDAGVRRRRLLKVNAHGHLTPVVYVHSGHTAGLTIRQFAEALGPDQPVFGLEPFLSEDIDPESIPGVEVIADECLVALREEGVRPPYILAGHSIGGFVAYHLATMLELAGEDVPLLALLDPPAPYTQALVSRVRARVRELTGTGPEPRRADLHRDVWRVATRGLRRGGEQRVGGWPAPLQARVEEIERSYSPPRYGGRAIVYATATSVRFAGSRTLGWNRYIDGPLEVRRAPGKHVTMLLEPDISETAALLAADVRGHAVTAPQAALVAARSR